MSDATIVTGSIKSVTIHSREFPVDAGCEAQLNVGGLKNTVTVSGSGASIITQEQIPWSLFGVEIAISDDRGELGILASLFNSAVEHIGGIVGGLGIPVPPTGPDRLYLADIAEIGAHLPILVTLVDDTVWAGRGTIVGPIDTSTKTGLARIDFMGDGRMGKQ